jgi:hypothetical protein
LADAAAAFFERKTAFLVEITTKKPAPLCVEQAFWGSHVGGALRVRAFDLG